MQEPIDSDSGKELLYCFSLCTSVIIVLHSTIPHAPSDNANLTSV